jgi:hypothetical protein
MYLTRQQYENTTVPQRVRDMAASGFQNFNLLGANLRDAVSDERGPRGSSSFASAAGAFVVASQPGHERAIAAPAWPLPVLLPPECCPVEVVVRPTSRSVPRA